MTIQEQELKVALTKKIQEWIDEQCDGDNWALTGIIVHDEIAEDMADSSFGVFQAVHKSQRYGKEQGFL